MSNNEKNVFPGFYLNIIHKMYKNQLVFFKSSGFLYVFTFFVYIFECKQMKIFICLFFAETWFCFCLHFHVIFSMSNQNNENCKKNTKKVLT